MQNGFSASTREVRVSYDHKHELLFFSLMTTYYCTKSLSFWRHVSIYSEKYYEYNTNTATILTEDVTKLKKTHISYSTPDINASTNGGISLVSSVHNLYQVFHLTRKRNTIFCNDIIHQNCKLL